MLAYLPSYQSLGPFSGWKWNRQSDLPFPLSHPRTRLYYLGRNAIYHGAKALGLGPGDEVLFPSYHSGTESAPLMHLGCKLNFYSVGADLDLDLDEIESKIGPATRAIHVIHFHGFPAPIEELRRLADRHGLLMIEDVALSFLGSVGGRPLGTWGDIGVFCLYKTMPVAAGGALAVNRLDVELPAPVQKASLYSELNLTAKHVLNHIDMFGGWPGTCLRRSTEWCLKKAVSWRRPHLESPDSLLFEPQMLTRGMGPLTRWLIRWFNYARAAERRRANYEWLVGRLEHTGVKLLKPDLPEGAVPLFFPFLAEDKFGLVDALRAQKIEAIPVWGIHHPHLPRGEFPGTEYLVDHAVELPIHQDLSRRQLERIARTLLSLDPVPPRKEAPSLVGVG